MAKLTAEQRIEKVHVKLMRHKSFCLFSGLFMVGKVVVDDTTPTAKTNGVNVTYGNHLGLAFLYIRRLKRLSTQGSCPSLSCSEARTQG